MHIDNNTEQGCFDAAIRARSCSYSPYSGYAVGAAVFTSDTTIPIHAGTNVENASYGATICAERSAIMSLVSNHGRQDISLITVVSEDDPPAVPCALCLQVMAEFCKPDTRIAIGTPQRGVIARYRFAELLPHPFTLDSDRD